MMKSGPKMPQNPRRTEAEKADGAMKALVGDTAFERFDQTKAEGLRPRHDRVLVEILAPPNVTESGLFLPDMAVEAHYEPAARVLAVGPDVPGDLKEGDLVMCVAGSAHLIRTKHGLRGLVAHKAILGVWEGTGEALLDAVRPGRPASGLVHPGEA